MVLPGHLGLAAVWAVGAFASGPLHLGRIAAATAYRRPVLAPILLGPALAGVFVVGALVVREIPVRSSTRSARCSTTPTRAPWPLLVVVTAVNGIAEELFFRGAAYAAIPRHPVLWTTLAYAVATLATGNVMLSFAASCSAWWSACSAGRPAASWPRSSPTVWSLSMLFLLPLIFF